MSKALKGGMKVGSLLERAVSAKFMPTDKPHRSLLEKVASTRNSANLRGDGPDVFGPNPQKSKPFVGRGMYGEMPRPSPVKNKRSVFDNRREAAFLAPADQPVHASPKPTVAKGKDAKSKLEPRGKAFDSDDAKTKRIVFASKNVEKGSEVLRPARKTDSFPTPGQRGPMGETYENKAAKVKAELEAKTKKVTPSIATNAAAPAMGFGSANAVVGGALVGGGTAWIGSTEENRGVWTFAKGATFGAAGGAVVSGVASRGMISGVAEWGQAVSKNFDFGTEFAGKAVQTARGIESAEARAALFATGAMLGGGMFGTNRNRAQGLNSTRGNRFGG